MSTPHLPSPPRGPQCPPAALLEAMSAGEPAPAPAEAHVQGCATCSAHVAELAQAREAFVRQKPADLFLKQLQRREAAQAAAPAPWRRFLPVLAAVVPLALLTVVGVRVWNPDASGVDPRGGGVTLKGGEFKVTVLHEGSEPTLLRQDDPVRAGDRLRFAYVAPKDGFLLVLELDGAGQASVFHPFGGMMSAPHAGTSQAFVPGSVSLDSTPGTSFLFAVFSEQKLEAEPLLAQLRAQGGTAEPRVECGGCSVARMRLRKVAP